MTALYTPMIYAKVRMRKGVVRIVELYHRDKLDLDNLELIAGYRVTKTGERWSRYDGKKMIDGVDTEVHTEEFVVAGRNDLVYWMRQSKLYGELEQVGDPLAEPEMQ